MACVFCGETRKRSREHVFPQWLDPLFPNLGDSDYLRRLVTPSTNDERRHPSGPFDLVVADICEVCNNGWMSRLEQEAQPILIPMLLDQPRKLTAPEQETVATWATKTMLVMQGANIGGERFTPGDEYRWFCEHRMPLPNSHVWLCRYGGDGNWPLTVHQYGAAVKRGGAAAPEPSEPPNAFSVVFAIGPLVFRLFGHNVGGDFAVSAGSDDAHLLIWPALGADIRWPPQKTLETDTELEQFARQLPSGLPVQNLLP